MSRVSHTSHANRGSDALRVARAICVTRSDCGVAALAVAAILLGALLLACNLVVSAGTAWAASLTIGQPAGVSQSINYKAYQVFQADVDSSGKASNVQWPADGSHKATVLASIDAAGYRTWLKNHDLIADASAEYASMTAADKANYELAQNAAEFISAEIAASDPSGTGAKNGGSFADVLARAVAADAVGAADVSGASPLALGSQGYWLVVADANSLTAGDTLGAGTAPMWLPVGAADLTAQAKMALPSFAKQVKEDSTSAFGAYADANVGQALDYRLVATLPSNLDAYSAYHLKFQDELPAGMSFVSAQEAVSVSVGGSPYTDAAITLSGSSLSVDIPDVKTVSGAAAGAQVTVEYQAKLTGSAAKGSAGNTNAAKLTYTKDPVSLTDGESVNQVAKAYTYQIDVRKAAKDNDAAIEGAKFTIQPGDTSSAEGVEYVQQDGSIGAAKYEFVTGVDGMFSVPGLDAGIYTVRETFVPAEYDALTSPAVMSLSSTIGDAGLTALGVTVAGVSNDYVQLTAADHAVNGAAATITFKNDKHETELPGTGMTPSQLRTVAGALLVAAGIALAMVRRRCRR